MAAHICAECTDFIGGGDWGLCCKSLKYNDLCYEFSAACERFKPGREIDPAIIYTNADGQVTLRTYFGRKSFEYAVRDAKRIIARGDTDVRVVDFIKGKPHCAPLLWNEEYGIEVPE